MHLQEISGFEVVHAHLTWPWIAIDPSRARLAYPSSARAIASRVFGGAGLATGATFALPADLALPADPAPVGGHRGAPAGLHGFAIDPTGTLLAATGPSVVVTLDARGELARTRLDALAGGDFTPHAVAFDRKGERLWISAESGEETALVLIDARSHALHGVVRSAPLPAQATHELHVHAADDAVLLLATCGEAGVFARVAGWSDGPPVAVPGALDGGGISVGFVGFSADGARVHLVESDELRTHAWPGLEQLSSIELADDFASSYAGVVLGERVLVDGVDVEREEDAVMVFDRSALVGKVAPPPVPSGMWVGRLGDDAIVTVEAKGDPARGRVVRLPAPKS